MLGSQIQFPSVTGPSVHVIPHGAGARLRFAHESATAAAGTASAAAAATATITRLIENSFRQLPDPLAAGLVWKRSLGGERLNRNRPNGPGPSMRSPTTRAETLLHIVRPPAR